MADQGKPVLETEQSPDSQGDKTEERRRTETVQLSQSSLEVVFKQPTEMTESKTHTQTLEVIPTTQRQNVQWRDYDEIRPPPSYQDWQKQHQGAVVSSGSDTDLPDLEDEEESEYSESELPMARATTPDLSDRMAAPLLEEHQEGSARAMFLSTPKSYDQATSPLPPM